MSAQAVSASRRAPLPSFAPLIAAGPVALLLVLVGGLALGISLWYVAIVRVGDSTFARELALVLSLPIGIASAFVGWFSYGTYFARRAGIERHTALRWDAPSWAAFAVN